MQTDATIELLAQMKQGRKAALQMVFEMHYPDVCRAIFRLVPDQDTMKDLAQEVFIRFWEKREQIEITGSLSGYLHRMAVNEALMHLRRQRFHEDADTAVQLPASAADGAETALMQRDLSERLHAAMDALPPRCRLMFQLSRFEEMTYQEIADHTGTSIKTVENQMGKALKLLREQLADFLP